MAAEDCAPCPNIEKNKEICTCSSEGCARRGFCCQCVAAHKAAGNLPSCLRNL